VHILSNGRLLSDPGYAALFDGIHPLLSWGIPLYGTNHALHDYIVQAQGAFADTISGLYAAARAHQRIEIRIVLVRPVVENLRALARYICRNLPFVEHVTLMGTEPIGFAKAHYNDLWIDPADANEALDDAIETLEGYGIATSIYNVPLCVLHKDLRNHARDSISHWKRTFLPACDGCSVKDRCAGFFSWITPAWTSRAISPINLEVT
jgi:His-Xaa-Ser system radical SAM maturase HxsC